LLMSSVRFSPGPDLPVLDDVPLPAQHLPQAAIEGHAIAAIAIVNEKIPVAVAPQAQNSTMLVVNRAEQSEHFRISVPRRGLKTGQHLGMGQPCGSGCARILRIRTCICRTSDRGDLIRV
jgi:hypothetical protein